MGETVAAPPPSGVDEDEDDFYYLAELPDTIEGQRVTTNVHYTSRGHMCRAALWCPTFFSNTHPNPLCPPFHVHPSVTHNCEGSTRAIAGQHLGTHMVILDIVPDCHFQVHSASSVTIRACMAGSPSAKMCRRGKVLQDL